MSFLDKFLDFLVYKFQGVFKGNPRQVIIKATLVVLIVGLILYNIVNAILDYFLK